MSVKKVDDQGSSVDAFKKSDTKTIRTVQPPPNSIKKIQEDDPTTQYEPEYTGTLFLGSQNGIQIPGPSAYDIAVAYGFEGTEQEWLDSLNGDAGIPPGGEVGEVLGKASSDDHDYDWVALPAGTLPVSKDLTYDGLGRLYQVISVEGTKTLSYNLDGTLNTVSNTADGSTKTMVYDVDGKLDAVDVYIA